MVYRIKNRLKLKYFQMKKLVNSNYIKNLKLNSKIIFYT